MQVLIAEDDHDIAFVYKQALERIGHRVIITSNGEDCLKVYHSALERGDRANSLKENPPFDAVVLDYRMPKKDGMEVAREILSANPLQRIVFASAYVRETLIDSVKHLEQIVELMQKPFEPHALIDTLEDKEIYAELEKLNVNIKNLKGLHPSHIQVRDLLDGLSKIMKGRTFQSGSS